MATQRQQKLKDTQVEVLTAESIQFADARIPDFKKIRGLEYIPFGEGNDYPDYLLMLYDKSAKHGAIIANKVVYILGNGFDTTDETVKQFLSKANPKQSWDDLSKPICLDIENTGGVYLEVIPKQGGGYNYYHISCEKMRTNEDNSKFWYKKDWKKKWDDSNMKQYPAFYNGIKEKSIFYYKEYRSGKKPYALPSWVAACNWIESDIEVSKCTLTNAKTGFSASKFINFYNGEPDETKKKGIQKRLENAATGSEGKKLLIGFNNDPLKKPTVDDLGQSDLTKEDFSQVDDLITNNIFAGHCVTHPLLFGIQQEGKLGNSQELKLAFEIFKGTYANAKQRNIEGIVKRFAAIAGVVGEIKLKDIDPIGLEISDTLIQAALDRDEIRECLGYDKGTELEGAGLIAKSINSLSPLVANKVLESMTPNEIRSLAGLAPNAAGNSITAPAGAAAPVKTSAEDMAVNSVLTNLTGRQHQQIARIVKQYGQNKLTEAQATLMLKNGFGFTDEDVKAYLGIEDQQFTTDFNEIDVALMFSEVGEGRDSYNLVKSDSYVDEDGAMQFAFKTASELNALQTKILGVIKKDSKATNEVIAKALGVPLLEINTAIDELVANKMLQPAESIGGVRKIITNTPVASLPQVMIRYSYEKRAIAEGPEILPTTRPFCKKLLELNKYYTREEIQKISERLGYSVFKRAGGFWNNNGTVDKQCRHEWKQNVVIKKS